MSSPTERSIAFLEEEGWDVEKTEKVIRIPPEQRRPGMPPVRRKDLFGFGDLLAIKEGERHLVVQTTSGSNVSGRLAKITLDPAVAPRAERWLRTNGRIVIHGWRYLKRTVNRKHWHAVLREVTLADFDRDAMARAAASARAEEEEATRFVEQMARP